MAALAAAVALIPLGSPAAEESDFIPLLNGRDLSGWVNVNCAPETWTWQTTGSAVYCTGTPTGVLRTERMYQNFVLELEWRHLKPKGNAGVFVWADPHPAPGVPFVRGIEVQVLDGQEGSWFTSDGDIFPIHGAKMTPENGRGGDRAFPTEKRQKNSPEWNSYRIACNDGAIALEVNGKVVTRGHSASPRKGYICLEAEGSPAEFRNIRIKQLPAKAALAPEQIASAEEGYVALYNGLDLRGWTTTVPIQQNWKSADWILEGSGGKGNTDETLWSEGEFGDYQLSADWRYTKKPDDNQSSATETAASSVPGKESSKPAAILLRSMPGFAPLNFQLSPDGTVNIQPRGHEGDTAKSGAARPRGEWNRLLVTIRGNELSVSLNGQRLLEKVQFPFAARGKIGLSPSSEPIQFANILIHELD